MHGRTVSATGVWRVAAARVLSRGRGLLRVAPLLAILLGAGPVQGQFSVQPVIVEMPVVDSVSGTAVAVRNESTDTLRLRVYAADFDQRGEGTLELFEPGEHPNSCSDRLEVFPDNLVLAPGEAGEVRLRMGPGRSTCWSMVFAQSQARSSSGIQVAQRIGVKVYGVSGASRPEGEVSRVEVIEGSSGARSVKVGFRNTGPGPVRPEGELEIRDHAGTIVEVLPIAPFSVLPGRARATEVPLGLALEPGRYMVIPILDFGGDYLAGGQAPFEVKD